MDRVTHGYCAMIEAAYGLIPAGLHPLIRPHFLCGTDPVFAGLHGYVAAQDGRSYRSTAHVAYPHHQTALARLHRRTTVIIAATDRLYADDPATVALLERLTVEVG